MNVYMRHICDRKATPAKTIEIVRETGANLDILERETTRKQ